MLSRRFQQVCTLAVVNLIGIYFCIVHLSGIVFCVVLCLVPLMLILFMLLFSHQFASESIVAFCNCCCMQVL